MGPPQRLDSARAVGLLLAVLGAGLTRAMDDAIQMLQRTGQPLWPRGEESRNRQE